MPRSDDAYDLVHTYDQAKAGKSKTSRPAVREIGRDGAAVETYVSEEQTEADVRTPPSGVHLLFFNESGNLRQKNSTGTVSVPGGTAPSDASFVTVNTDANLSDERTLATGTGLGLTDAGAGNSLTVDADTLRGEPFVTTASASSLSGETVAGVLSDVYGSPVQVGSGTDLRLDTGQSVEDGNGTSRLSLGSDRTRVRNETGNTVLDAKGGTDTNLIARSGVPVRVFDAEGGSTAVQYDTDASAGVLRTPNAAIQVEETAGGTPTQDSLFLEYFSGVPKGRIITRAVDGTLQTTSVEGSTVEVTSFSGLIDMSGQGSDLRLATGQSIEDGSGTPRLKVRSGDTTLTDQANFDRVIANNGTALSLEAYSGDPVRINDNNGGFTAVEYQTSSSAPGELRLENAGIELFGEGAGFGIEWQSPFVGGGSNNPSLFVNSSGEIVAQDSNGNQTVIT